MAVTRIRTGKGRVEFATHHAEILELLNQGHTITSAYEKLKEERNLSQSYATFAGLIRKEKKELEEQQRKMTKSLPALMCDEKKRENIGKHYNQNNGFTRVDKNQDNKF